MMKRCFLNAQINIEYFTLNPHYVLSVWSFCKDSGDFSVLQMALSPHLALKRRCLLLTSTTDIKVSSFNFTRVKPPMPTALHGMQFFKHKPCGPFQIWICACMLRPGECFKLLVGFLRLFLRGFCGINTHCPAGWPVSSGCTGAIEGMFDLQGCLNVIQGVPAEKSTVARRSILLIYLSMVVLDM